MRRRAPVIALSVLAAALLLVVVAFAFGTPQAPIQAPASAPTAPAPGGTPPAGSSAGEGADEIATGEVPAPDPSSPLAIEIPGCVCHSDDPAVVEEHAEYRMNQCFGCHAGGMPEMGG